MNYLEEGLIHNEADSLSGNGFLFTAEALIAGCYPLTAPELYCWIEKHFTGKPPVLMRTCENEFGQASYDEYLGFLYTCKHFGWDELASKILSTGKLSHYVYNNITYNKFNFRAWMGRYPQLIAAMNLVSGGEPSFLGKWWTILLFLITRPSEDLDKTIRPWVLSRIVYGHSKVLDFAIRKWRIRAIKMFGTPDALLFRYFKHEHPIVDALTLKKETF